MPAIIAGSISILSNAGLGMAMFSLGMFNLMGESGVLWLHFFSNRFFDGVAGLFMALQPKMIACGNSIATFAMAVRFIAGPAVMAAASFAVGLKGVLLHIAIVQVKGFPNTNQVWFFLPVDTILLSLKFCRQLFLKGLSPLCLPRNTMFILTF